MSDRIQLKRDLAINWTSTNPTLYAGEIGYETNTGKLKVGDGSTVWNSLSYYSAGSVTIEDTPVSGHTTTGISSNWAYTHAASNTAHGITGSNTGDETTTRIASINHGATVKTALIDADEITGQDSANTFSLIRTTWTSVKAFLKTYFDNIYTLSNLGGVSTTRTITATTPITIDGTTSADLSVNRTIAMPAATASLNGYATSAQITKLDGITSGANLYVHPNHSGEVTSAGDGATTIANAVVTLAKMSNLANNTIIGRVSSGTGVPEALTGANVLTIIGTVPILYGTGDAPSASGLANGTLYFKHS